MTRQWLPPEGSDAAATVIQVVFEYPTEEEAADAQQALDADLGERLPAGTAAYDSGTATVYRPLDLVAGSRAAAVVLRRGRFLDTLEVIAPDSADPQARERLATLLARRFHPPGAAPSCPRRVVAFFRLDVSAQVARDTSDQVRAAGGVDSSVIFERGTAFSEHIDRYDALPPSLPAVQPADLPVSLRIVADDPTRASDVAAVLERDPAVTRVLRGDDLARYGEGVQPGIVCDLAMKKDGLPPQR